MQKQTQEEHYSVYRGEGSPVKVTKKNGENTILPKFVPSSMKFLDFHHSATTRNIDPSRNYSRFKEQWLISEQLLGEGRIKIPCYHLDGQQKVLVTNT